MFECVKKMTQCDIVWTPIANLRKDKQTMDTGTVGFKNEKQCFFVRNHPKNRDDLKRLEKSKKEDTSVDLRGELEQREKTEVFPKL
jgi:hypothetical protein